MKKLETTLIMAMITVLTVHQFAALIPQSLQAGPNLSFEVWEAYFSPVSYPGAANTNLYIVLNNTGNRITYAVFSIRLPDNFTIRNPKTRAQNIAARERFTLTFSGICIPSNAMGNYPVIIYVNATDGSGQWSQTTFYTQVSVGAQPLEESIMLATVNTLYEGNPAPLLQYAKNVVLRVYLINKFAESINAMSIDVTLPSGIYAKAIAGTYVGGMTPGGTCYIDITVDSGYPSLGRHRGILHITYVKTISSASFMMRQNISFQISVESAHSYIPDISFIEAYWGTPENPTPAYHTSRYVPLTVKLANNGRYNIHGVVVNVSSKYLKPIKDSEACATVLAPGDSCTAVLYFDINTNALEIPVTINVHYKFTEFGTHLEARRTFNVTLPIEKYPAEESILMLVSAGWQNNVKVFPRTQNATYQVTLANRASCPISGISLELRLPEGLKSKGSDKATAYVEGPIRSLGTFTATFTISIGDVPPGSYAANLTVDCIAASGGPGVRLAEKFNLTISISDDSVALEVVDSRWYEGAVGPDTYGAHLVVLIRNVYVDGLRGAVLELDLPRGICNSADNSNRAKAAPTSVQLPQTIQPQNIMEALSTILSAPQVSPAQVFNRGDTLAFTFTLNIFDASLGQHEAKGKLSYIDAWGGKRETLITVPITILGRAGYVEATIDGSIKVRSRMVNASLTIKNHGTSPIYDAYVAVLPYQGTPILIASPAVNYVEKVDPKGTVKVPITLAYNPLGFYGQIGGATTITYGPVPLMISLVYRDAAGYLRTFNNSVTVVVEPFIELTIRNLRAAGSNTSTTVTGIILNYGSSTAYRAEAEVIMGETVQTSFIGDIDPGSEVAFRVDVDRYNATATLKIKYYNVFNELEAIQMPIKVYLKEEAAPVIKPEQPQVERWIIVAGVLVFLFCAALIIYRMMKKSRNAART
ncbi:MAG: hypothetical protein N3F10_02585 [Candidatus Bathyarchaeota archaeon]|nr:hypothetical protein [Candidatus Bathyarchaeota archaeon]